MVLLVLASAKQQVLPYEGKFEAPWLLTPFSALIWETTNRGREELRDGQWCNTIRIDWRIQLPNGALLTDARNEQLLTITKKIAFLMRSGLVRGNSAPKPWRNSVGRLLGVIRWVALHEEKFLPERYGLRQLDQPTIDWLFSQFAEGGSLQAHQVPQRILTAMFKGAYGTACPQALLDDPYNVPAAEIGSLVKWLESENYYKAAREGMHYGKRHLKRTRFAELISENPLAFKGANIGKFFRQFEPDFSKESLLVRLQQITEFPSQSAENVNDIKSGVYSEEAVENLAKTMATIMDAHRHIPDLIPEPAHLSLRRATSIAKRVTRPTSHTLFMPINTGLAYLNVAMRFVHMYGEAIIDAYLSIIADYKPATATIGLNKSFNKCLNDWRIPTGESIAAILGITKFRVKEKIPDFQRLRSHPTLDEALRVLVGSCVVCMALLKPSREEELTHLKRDCVREYAGGYWINFKLGKSNSGEAWQDEDRPIPFIAAKAIYLLQRLGGGLSTLFGEDRKIRDNLFYLPKEMGTGALAAHADLLNNHLNVFCDYVGLPPDSEGRRWYVRIHEMRKWFLLLLFWSGRFDVLDAARWVAGHADAGHVYAYIEKEFPGEELPRLEAEYSIDRVYRFEQERKRGKGDTDNEDGVNALYEAVLQHFNVEALTMVPESEWASYVQSLRYNGGFHLEPHSIYDENGDNVVGLNISFVMRGAI